MSEAWEKMKARSEKANKVIHVNVKTNADTIRAMSDKELAEHFSGRCCPVKDAFYNCVTFDQESCKHCWLVWLRSPTEDSHEP